MQVLQIEDPARRSTARYAPFALAFRPFFLLAGWSAALLVAVWATAFAAGWGFNTPLGYIGWHSHEMVFGYSTAVIAGFLLTAARNWTGVQTARGPALAGLAAVWLLGRLLPATPLPGWAVAAADLVFLPLLAAALAGPLLRARHYKSLMFVAILALLFAANLAVHMGGFAGVSAQGALYFAVDLIIVLIVIMGGRVIPFFTEKAVAVTVREREWLDRLAVASVVLLAIVELVAPGSAAVAAAALVAGLSNGVRLAGWYSGRMWRVPILWILHTGYAWLVIGLLLKGAAPLVDSISPLLALHALTAGGIGAATLGMMARVALGHTGRMLQPPAGMTSAFVLINIATAVRVFAPMALPQAYAWWIGLSGGLWATAFLIFAIAYTPILIRPRVDGMPG